MELAQPAAAAAPDAAYASAMRSALRSFHAQQPAVMESHCVAALHLRPDSAHALQLMGVALHLQGRHADALPWMDRAALAQPASTELHINRGEVLRSLQRWAEAEQAFELALTLSPGNAEALNNLGLVQQARGRFDAAEASYRAALQARPGHVESLNNLGTLLQETRRPDQAEASYRQVLAAQPGHRNALNNLATIAKEGGRVDEARALYRQVLADAPDFWRSWNSLGQLAKDQGDYDEAIACYRRSLAIAPGNADTLYNVALLELLFGDRHGDNGRELLAQGFEHYEVRYDGRSQNKSAPKPPELGCPMWRGEPLAGKHIALVREQGLGDQLQFCRYAALVRALGAEVTLIVDGPLVELMQTLDGPTRVIAPGQQRDYVYDYWAFQLSLPHRLGTTLASIPAATPYLQADSTTGAHWRQLFDALGAGPKVGIVWAGNPEHANNRNRSMNLADLAPLFEVPGIHLVSLQKGAAAVQELRASQWADRILDLDADLTTYADTAAVLAELDLLISVDTSVVHLAGALNRPCWALLAHGPDWRWLRGRNSSPWYPSVRLFRQGAPRQWQGPVVAVRDELSQLLHTWPRPADTTSKNTPMDSATSHATPAQAAQPTAHIAPEASNIGSGPRLIAQRACRYGTMFYFKRDKYVGDALARYGEFSQAEADLFAKLVKPGMVVAEVGANIGAHTVMLAKALGPSGELLAFEPQRWVHQILCANLAVNELLNTRAYQLAVGDAAGSIDVPLWDPAAMNNIGGISMGHVDGAAHDKVELRTLDSFALPRLDFLKVDVEGMELQVLRGADATLRRTRPILYVENDRAERSKALMDHIVSLGYELWWHFPAMFNKHNFAGQSHDVFPGIVSVNLLCIPNERHMDVQGMDRATDTGKDWRTVVQDHNDRVTQNRRTH